MSDYGYRLAHAPEREVVGGFARAADASDALARALRHQPGAEGRVAIRRGPGDEWRPLGEPVPWWW